MTLRPESKRNQGYDERKNRDKRVRGIRAVIEIMVLTVVVSSTKYN